uniref:Fic family protein n=1 Tax=Fundidesulfovibrio putealis TaxID=270496 RepID=A0A7C4EHZ4_9BACT
METTARIEPCLPETFSQKTLDLVAALVSAAKHLEERFHPRTGASLAGLVRIMNCYYSNLIEGHNTTPREIESALHGQFAEAPERRNLQFEARAHIRLQAEIDRLHGAGELPEPASTDFLCWLHREFYKDAPDEMLFAEGSGRKLRVVPGEMRKTPEEEVSVGRHLPPSSAVIPAFMEHFARRYRFESLGQGGRIAAMAAAHHRLNYIHPFVDGNGRVSRLMSHAMALAAGIGAHGLWSVSRGLARGLSSRSDYLRMMDLADSPRRGDLDGRGNLSLAALNEFTDWFLAVCIDQVTFMTEMFGLDALRERLADYAAQKGFRPEAFRLLDQVMLRGQVARGDMSALTGLKERTARDLLAALLKDGILASGTPKGPVHLRVSLAAAETLFPSLFPRL